MIMEDKIEHMAPAREEALHDFVAEWRTLQYGMRDDSGTLQHIVEQRLICECKCGPEIIEWRERHFLVRHNNLTPEPETLIGYIQTNDNE